MKGTRVFSVLVAAIKTPLLYFGRDGPSCWQLAPSAVPFFLTTRRVAVSRSPFLLRLLLELFSILRFLSIFSFVFPLFPTNFDELWRRRPISQAKSLLSSRNLIDFQSHSFTDLSWFFFSLSKKKIKANEIYTLENLSITLIYIPFFSFASIFLFVGKMKWNTLGLFSIFKFHHHPPTRCNHRPLIGYTSLLTYNFLSVFTHFLYTVFSFTLFGWFHLLFFLTDRLPHWSKRKYSIMHTCVNVVKDDAVSIFEWTTLRHNNRDFVIDRVLHATSLWSVHCCRIVWPKIGFPSTGC